MTKPCNRVISHTLTRSLQAKAMEVMSKSRSNE